MNIKADLEYLAGNADVPAGVVTSTARKGSKWQSKVKCGDVVNLKITGGEVFGQATILKVMKTDYADVISNADKNHVLYGKKVREGGFADVVLAAELNAAYGKNEPDDEYTVVMFVRHND